MKPNHRTAAPSGALGALVQLMEERVRKVELGQASAAELEPLTVVLDESSCLASSSRDQVAVDEVTANISRFARLARAARVDVRLGLNRAEASGLCAAMQSNFAVRVSAGESFRAAAGESPS